MVPFYIGIIVMEFAAMKQKIRSCYDEAMYIKQKERCKNGKYILSYGGGVNSSALFFYIVEKKLPLDLVIFADTGEEMPETYEAVERMKKECSSRDIPFVVVRSKYGSLYDYYFSKKMVAGMMNRDCTSKFKLSPITNYLRNTYGKHEKFNVYIGIAYDERSRMRNSKEKYKVNHYPFCDEGIDRKGNLAILERYNFPAIKSGCKGCIFLKKSQWIDMARKDPTEFQRWVALDKNNKRYPNLTWCPMFKLEDIQKSVKEQTFLIDFEEETPSLTCDAGGGCFL